MANAKCPKCGKAIAKLMIESIAATLDGKDKTFPAVVFSCGSCRSVLSVQVDPHFGDGRHSQTFHHRGETPTVRETAKAVSLRCDLEAEGVRHSAKPEPAQAQH